MSNITTVNFNGTEIEIKENEKMNLTDLWKAAGSPEGQEVWRWTENVQSADFVLALIKELKPQYARGLKSKPKGLAQKKELSAWVKEVFNRAVEAGLMEVKRGR